MKVGKTILITIIVIGLIIAVLCVIADNMWSSSGKHGAYEAQESISNSSSKSNSIKSLNEMAKEYNLTESQLREFIEQGYTQSQLDTMFGK